MGRKRYVLQESGSVTLPAEFRRKYGLKPGDEINFIETDKGLLISPREALINQLLDEIGDDLRESGVTLEELIESGREIRQEIYNEKYARDKKD